MNFPQHVHVSCTFDVHTSSGVELAASCARLLQASTSLLYNIILGGRFAVGSYMGGVKLLFVDNTLTTPISCRRRRHPVLLRC